MGVIVYAFTIPIADMWHWTNLAGMTLCLPIFICGASLFLGIEGLEIDTENKQIRKYTTFLKWKYGDWVDFTEFDRITLDQYKAGQAGHSYSMFSVVLEGKDYSILVEEYKSYNNAFEWMEFFCHKTGIQTHDKLQERIYKAKTGGRRR